MRSATIKEFCDRATNLLRGSESLLITRRGKSAGLYLPLSATDDLPLELRRELEQTLVRAVHQASEENGIQEVEILRVLIGALRTKARKW